MNPLIYLAWCAILFVHEHLNGSGLFLKFASKNKLLHKKYNTSVFK